MTIAFLQHLLGEEKINPAVNEIEYTPHVNALYDPFSIIFKVCLRLPCSVMDG